MALSPAVIKATIAAIESLLAEKDFEAAKRELRQLFKVGAHEGSEKQRILALCKRVRQEGSMLFYGPHCLTLEHLEP